MKIAVMTNPYELMNETHIINGLFHEGLEELHVRKPAMNRKDMIAYLEGIHPEYHNRIILHSHFSLVHKFNVRGVHMDEDLLKNSLFNWFLDVFVIRKRGLKKCVTVHSTSHVAPVAQSADEILLGPVFRKVSQFNCSRMLKREKILKTLERYSNQLVGLGSVCMQTIDEYQSLGFRSVTVQSAVWKCPDPVASFIALRNHVYQSPLKVAA
ncbi:MAG: hypothetical protein U0T84_11150 [Chitinophagales bacterium]